MGDRLGQVIDESFDTLIEACLQGEEGAVDRFYRLVHPELVSYARRRGADDPEGLANMAVFEVVRRLEHLRSLQEDSVRAYLYRALKSRLIDEQRRRRLVEVPLVEEGAAEAAVSEHRDDEPDDASGFRDLLSLLTDAEQDVIAHRFLAGYSSAETARRLGRSPAAVRRLQHDALARLRVLLVAAVLLILAAVAVMVLGDRVASTSRLELEPAETPEVDRGRSERGLEDVGPGGRGSGIGVIGPDDERDRSDAAGGVATGSGQLDAQGPGGGHRHGANDPSDQADQGPSDPNQSGQDAAGAGAEGGPVGDEQAGLDDGSGERPGEGEAASMLASSTTTPSTTTPSTSTITSSAIISSTTTPSTSSTTSTTWPTASSTTAAPALLQPLDNGLSSGGGSEFPTTTSPMLVPITAGPTTTLYDPMAGLYAMLCPPNPIIPYEAYLWTPCLP